MAKAKIGDTVRVHYTGSLKDGTKFDSSINREPLEFIIGEGKLLKDFENAVVGLEPGEKNSVTIEAENAYGPVKDELIVYIPQENIPVDINPEIGMRLQMQTKDQRTLFLRVIDINEDSIKVDANHDLAGEDLNFEIELLEIAG